MTYVQRTFRICYVRVTYVWPGVSSTLLSYLRRISDVRVAYLAYQWRMCYVCVTYVSLLWSMCDVLWVLGTFCGIPRESLILLYKCFRFFRNNGSDVSHGPGRRAGFFQGYAWCSLCLYSWHPTTRMGSLEMSPRPHPLPSFFFSSVLI